MDIVIRSVTIFVFLWLVVRVSGKREVGQLSAFDMILLVTVGDLVSQGVVQEDYSVTTALMAVATISVCGYLLSWVNAKFPQLRPVLAGRPRVVVRDGEPVLEVLRGERLTLDDLHEAARRHGIRRLREIELAVLETTGTFSFFTVSPDDVREEPPPEDDEEEAV